MPAIVESGMLRTQVTRQAGEFFDALNRQQYKKAFNFLSRRLRIYYTVEEFELKAKRVHSARVIEFRVTEKYNNLVRLDTRGKLQLWYEGMLYHAIYEGNVNLVKEGKDWKIDSCFLEPVGNAKPVSGKGKDKPGIRFEL